MITGEIKSRIDAVWNAFWTGGISNPMEVIEQITYLLFLRRLDDLQTLEENLASRTGKAIRRRTFPEGADPRGRPYRDFRWSHFKNFSPGDMFVVIGEHVFPFLRSLGGDGSTYAHHMKDARFTIPTPALLAKVVDLLDAVPMEDRDTKGDLYEYMLGKIASAGQNGQFRTPRHIIGLMVEMTAPQPTDLICDPACGTAGFLVAAGEFIRDRHPKALHDATLNEHFHQRMFHGFDFDNTMLRIGSMNMLLHGVEQPDIRYRDSLAQEHSADEEAYTLVLANPPFAGSLDYENTAKDLLQIVKTKKTELLFLACSCVCSSPAAARPSSCPTASCSDRAKRTRNCGACSWKTRSWMPSCRCLAASSSPTPACPRPSCFSPRPTRAARTSCGSTTWTPTAGAWTTSARRSSRRTSSGPSRRPASATRSTRRTTCRTSIARWQQRDGAERDRPRTAQSFCVPKADIAAQGYDLSLNRYKEVVHEEVAHRPPTEILAELAKIEEEIQQGMRELEGMIR